MKSESKTWTARGVPLLGVSYSVNVFFLKKEKPLTLALPEIFHSLATYISSDWFASCAKSHLHPPKVFGGDRSLTEVMRQWTVYAHPKPWHLLIFQCVYTVRAIFPGHGYKRGRATIFQQIYVGTYCPSTPN